MHLWRAWGIGKKVPKCVDDTTQRGADKEVDIGCSSIRLEASRRWFPTVFGNTGSKDESKPGDASTTNRTEDL